MVSGAQGGAVTIHRTYLSRDGQKAAVESPNKLVSYPQDRKIIGGGIRPVRAALFVVPILANPPFQEDDRLCFERMKIKKYAP